MAVSGIFSSVNLIAGAGLLGNVGGVPITANVDLSNNISSYTSINVVSRFANIASSGYVDQNVVANIFPALTNAIPTAYQGTLGSGTMTAAINFQSNKILCNGDIGKFAQVFSAAQAFVSQTNQLIWSSVNANASPNTTAYSNQNNLITGGFSEVSLAFGDFGTDLNRLGNMINLNDLNNFGSPASLLQQIASLANPTPALTTALLNSGVPADVVDDLSNAQWTDRYQKLAYDAMTQITGTGLAEILRLLRVTTPNIITMADLLNPVKIFPLSYNTLTAPTSQGLRAIYINTQGNVNTNLETILPASVLAPLQGNPLQNLPRPPE
jgi:hypothetical protein